MKKLLLSLVMALTLSFFIPQSSYAGKVVINGKTAYFKVPTPDEADPTILLNSQPDDPIEVLVSDEELMFMLWLWINGWL